LWYKKKNNLALDLLSKGFAEFSGLGRNAGSKELEAKYTEVNLFPLLPQNPLSCVLDV